MQTFSIRELRERSGDLSREAEEGRLSLVTRHGQPLFVTVPFTEDLLHAGVHTSLALVLFKTGELPPVRAAKLAHMSLPQFLDYAASKGIAAEEYSGISESP